MKETRGDFARLAFVGILVIQTVALWAQNSVSVTGKVYDAGTNQIMEYATVALLRTDSSIVTGTVSDNHGKFELKVQQPGNYLLKVGFLGYERQVSILKIASGSSGIDIGEIKLTPVTNRLEEVTVKASKSSVEYKIDKKVITLGDNLATISGNAADVLANVPSVQVDIEGNVSLRGNSNFTVLIDDRPTVLDASEALQQIPASTIQNIEIITNPSAKYDPEGTAGIINIITKKRSLEGFSGIINLDAGLDEKYGGDVLLNYRTKHFNYFVGGEYGNRLYPGQRNEKYIKYGDNDSTYNKTSDGEYKRLSYRTNVRGGIEWYPDDKTVVAISGNYGYRSYDSYASTDFSTWTGFAGNTGLINSYTSRDTNTRGGDYYSVNADFTREFSSRDHKLSLQFMYYGRNGLEEVLNVLRTPEEIITNSQKSKEAGPSNGMNYRINYEQPISSLVNIEAGLQGEFGESSESNELYYYNAITGDYDFQDEYSRDVTYKRNINAAYGLVSGEYNQLGYQLGLRLEYTDRLVRLDDTVGETYSINRWDVFPTLHFSYQLNESNQFMANYTRRIDRPRGYYFEPFYTWTDAYNVRIGNPDIQPEYINSFELSYLREIGKHSISAEVFYDQTYDKIESIRSAYSDSVILRTYQNVGTDQSLGLEFVASLDLLDKWETDITARYYYYQVEGSYDEQDFNRSNYNWSIRWNNIIQLTKTTKLQFNPAYSSPEVEAQESESGYFIAEGAIQQSLLNHKMDITLQVRDIFATAKHESEINADDFYSYRLYTHKAPMVMLNLTWRINNYKSSNGKRRGGDMNGGGEDME